MPYDITKSRGKKGKGYTVKSKKSGRVAHIKPGPGAKQRLRGYLWHSEHGK